VASGFNTCSLSSLALATDSIDSVAIALAIALVGHTDIGGLVEEADDSPIF